MEVMKEAYDNLRKLVPEYYPPFEETVSTMEEMQILLLDINQYVQRTEARKTGTAPEGFWYMATLTSKPLGFGGKPICESSKDNGSVWR